MARTIVAATLGAAFLTLAAAGAAAADWHVDKQHSSVGFSATQQGSSFEGRFADFDAKIDFDPSAPMKGKIVGTVKTASVDTHDGDRDSQLPESDWFDSADHPEARYESTSIKKLSDGSYEADGKLTLKGTTKPVQLKFTFKTMNGGKAAKFDGKMTVNRLDFNVGTDYADPSFVGTSVAVQIMLDLKT